MVWLGSPLASEELRRVDPGKCLSGTPDQDVRGIDEEELR
jgi:hypothetical protein